MCMINDFEPFVPSDDYAVSKAFYECMGFKINWDDGEVCEVDTKLGYRFLLLPKNHNNYAHSLMLYFMVNSAQEWYDHFENIKLAEKFQGTKVAPPELKPWGLLIPMFGILVYCCISPKDRMKRMTMPSTEEIGKT